MRWPVPTTPFTAPPGCEYDPLSLKDCRIHPSEPPHVNKPLLIYEIYRHPNLIHVTASINPGDPPLFSTATAFPYTSENVSSANPRDIIQPDPLPARFMPGRARRIDQMFQKLK